MWPCSYFSLSSKGSEVICAGNDKKRVLCDYDVMKNVLKFQFFFCPENKNFVCLGLAGTEALRQLDRDCVTIFSQTQRAELHISTF